MLSTNIYHSIPPTILEKYFSMLLSEKCLREISSPFIDIRFILKLVILTLIFFFRLWPKNWHLGRTVILCKDFDSAMIIILRDLLGPLMTPVRESMGTTGGESRGTKIYKCFQTHSDYSTSLTATSILGSSTKTELAQLWSLIIQQIRTGFSI